MKINFVKSKTKCFNPKTKNCKKSYKSFELHINHYGKRFKIKHLLDIAFNENAFKTINDLQRKLKLSNKAEVIKYALTLYYICNQEIEKGNKIVFIKDKEIIQEVII